MNDEKRPWPGSAKWTIALLCFILFLIITFSIVFFAALSDGETGLDRTPLYYGEWKESTLKLMEEHSCGEVLPSKQLVYDYYSRYEYNYRDNDELSLSDFLIFVRLQLNEAEFQNEKTRIEELFLSNPDYHLVADNEKTYYLFKKDLRWWQEYCEENIFDGAATTIEIAAVDEKAKTIEYISAYQWDSNTDLFLQFYLETILNKIC